MQLIASELRGLTHTHLVFPLASTALCASVQCVPAPAQHPTWHKQLPKLKMGMLEALLHSSTFLLLQTSNLEAYWRQVHCSWKQ